MGKVEEWPIDERGRIQVTRETRRKMGVKGKGTIRVIVDEDGWRIPAPMTRQEFIQQMEGFIKGGKPPMEPAELKEIWEQPKR